MSGVTDSTAASILRRNSGRSAGSGGTYTLSFTYPHIKELQGVRSGDLAEEPRHPHNDDRSIVGEKQHSTNSVLHDESVGADAR